MALGIVARELRIEAVDAAFLGALFELLEPRQPGRRWVLWPAEEGGWHAVWPPTGEHLVVEDPEAHVRARESIGVRFSAAGFAAFQARFVDLDDAVLAARVAGAVAPVLPELHPGEVTGIDYALAPAERTQRIVGILGRFLPKGKAVALRFELPGLGRTGLYVQFDGHRRLTRIVGAPAWPVEPATGDLRHLKALGAPVEVGVELTMEGLSALVAGGLNRAGYARLFRAGDLRLEPAPVAVRVALKAARLT